jgi:hypothetical protein
MIMTFNIQYIYYLYSDHTTEQYYYVFQFVFNNNNINEIYVVMFCMCFAIITLYNYQFIDLLDSAVLSIPHEAH